MSNQICPCVYNESQNTSNTLTLIYTSLQILLFSYVILTENPHYFIKIMLGLFCGLALTLFVFGLMNIIRGTEENIKLREYYCKGIPLERKNDKECEYIYKQQNIVNFLNLFNSSVFTVACITLLYYYFKQKKLAIGSVVGLLFAVSTFAITFDTVKGN